MAIRKPTWLSNWLLRWNFTIFTWQLNIGDWIERPIDLVFIWLDTIFTWADYALDWAKLAWARTFEIGKEIYAFVNSEVQKLLNRIDVWWYQLAEWWQAKRFEIWGWIEVATQSLLEVVKDAKALGDMALAALQDFRKEVFTQFIPFSWIRTFYGAPIATIWDWFTPERQKISDEIEVSIKPVRDEVNRHTSWLDLMKDFFTEPEQFLYKIADRIIERFW